jgi:hypothetical protein
MQDIANTELPAPERTPWNKGKLTGAKPPLRQKHVWAIRTLCLKSALRLEWRGQDGQDEAEQSEHGPLTLGDSFG